MLVVEALFLTMTIVGCLTIYTFQTKWEQLADVKIIFLNKR